MKEKVEKVGLAERWKKNKKGGVKFNLTLEEAGLLNAMVRAPQILVNVLGADPKDFKPYKVKDYTTGMQILRLEKWVQKHLLVEKAFTIKVRRDGEEVEETDTRTIVQAASGLFLPHDAVDRILEIMNHYSSACAVMPVLHHYSHLKHKLEHKGEELEVEAYPDAEEFGEDEEDQAEPVEASENSKVVSIKES